MKKPILISALVIALGAVVFAQYGRRRGWDEIPPTAREARNNDTGLPTWTNPPAHAKDVFTFTRIAYDSGNRGYGRRGGGWATDLLEYGRDDGGGSGCSDLNLSWRLQQMTSLGCDL